jgi:hypothetical protein
MCSFGDVKMFPLSRLILQQEMLNSLTERTGVI